MVGNSFIDVWGPITRLSADKEAALARYRQLLTEASPQEPNASRGREVFQRTCAACHRLFDDGGQIGPDVTGANRTNRGYLLSNIVTPGAVIQDEYRIHLILTDDGRLYSGIPAEENDQQLSLHVANRDEPVVIARSRIASQELAPVSMMPGGLMEELSDQEVRDLFAYLQSHEQVPLPE